MSVILRKSETPAQSIYDGPMIQRRRASKLRRLVAGLRPTRSSKPRSRAGRELAKQEQRQAFAESMAQRLHERIEHEAHMARAIAEAEAQQVAALTSAQAAANKA